MYDCRRSPAPVAPGVPRVERVLSGAGRPVPRNERNVLAKLRVYELAKELGLTNKECIDLCNALGYGVKSHSSSLDGAYADQVRRKAQREGLIREQQPEEPAKKAPAKKAAVKKAAA